MKNYFPFLVFIILCYTAISKAQPFDYNKENFLLKKLHYENSSGEKGKTTFIYDINNYLYKAVWELLDSSRYSLNYYTLNNNIVTLVKRDFSDGLSSEKKFVYNDKGLVVEELFQRSDSVEGKAYYHYSEDDELIKLKCENMNGWFNGEIEYAYVNNIRKSANIYRNNKRIGSIKYNYSKNGNLIKEYWDFNGKWSQTFSYEYIDRTCEKWISSNPLLNFPCHYIIEIEKYDFNNESSGPSHFSYVNNGKLIEKTFTRSDGLKTRTTFDYDEQRRLAKSTRFYSYGSKGDFEYYYNSNNQIIEKRLVKDGQLISCESFAYDEHGNLRFARYDNMDLWLTGNIIFELDRYNRLVKGNFISDEGYSAIITFNYIESDLVSKINWLFSFGKTQTYQFTYKSISQD